MSDDDGLKSEFRPPDPEMIDYMMGLSGALESMCDIENLSVEHQGILEVSARSIKILLAMAISGHQLYMAEGHRLDGMADVARTLYDMLFLIEPQALEKVSNLHLLQEYSRWEDSVEGADPAEARNLFRNLFWSE